jgi:hypothetical protein
MDRGNNIKNYHFHSLNTSKGDKRVSEGEHHFLFIGVGQMGISSLHYDSGSEKNLNLVNFVRR